MDKLEEIPVNIVNSKFGSCSEILKVAYPLIIMCASHTIMQLIDRKFLSMLSTQDVAAALPGGILCFTMYVFFIVTVNFISAIVSQYYGARDHESCARSAWAGFYFAIAMGLACSFMLIGPGKTLIEMGGHSPEMTMKEIEFYETLMPGGGFIFMTSAFMAFFSGLGKTWTVAIVEFASCIVNIVLDYILIFGKFGFPALGITGAGLGTTLSCVFGFVFAFIVFIVQNQKKYPTRSSYNTVRFSDIKRIAVFGAPSGVQAFFSVSSFTFITFLIGRLGEAPMAATTIVTSINMISFLPLMGLSDAASIVTGQYIGRGYYNIPAKVARNSLFMATIYMTLMAFLYFIFPVDLINLFSPEKYSENFQEVLKHGIPVLYCAAALNFFSSVRFIYVGALRGAGDTQVPMWIVIACAWGILVPGGLIIIQVLHMSVTAIWAFMTFQVFILSILLYLRFRSGKWQKIKLIDRKKTHHQEMTIAQRESEKEPA